MPHIRNVYACLVHERRECVIDLVRNLRYHDPSSAVLLYNGGPDAELLRGDFPAVQHGAIVHPSPRPMTWGYLHGFALDCMRYALEHLSFDTLTIVDSDQLAVRSGYSEFLRLHLNGKSSVGMLGSSSLPQPSRTRITPAMTAWKEVDLWRPFFSRFPGGESRFAHWTFWPSTVFTSGASRDLVRLFDTDAQLQAIMGQSKIWATEEVILPTLVSLLGYEIMANPCGYDLVKFRVRYTREQLRRGLAHTNVFWIHPVARLEDDPLRCELRGRFNDYLLPSPDPRSAAVPQPVEAQHAPAVEVAQARPPKVEPGRPGRRIYLSRHTLSGLGRVVSIAPMRPARAATRVELSFRVRRWSSSTG